MLTIEEYNKLHTDLLVPLKYKINVDLFEKEIVKYKKFFKQWGPEHTNFPRFGLPLVNLTGNIDDEVDPSCWPVDRWNYYNPEKKYWETDFKNPTEVLNLSCFDAIQDLKPHMIRSNILLWHNTGHFKPHVDMVPELLTHIRIWGTNVDDSKYFFKYGKERIVGFEPGRLYLIDTIKEHQAFSVANGVYTFFIALNLNSIPKIENSKI